MQLVIYCSLWCENEINNSTKDGANGPLELFRFIGGNADHASIA